MKTIYLVISMLLCWTVTAQNEIPQISNVQTSLSGNTLIINYDLSDAENDAVDMSFRAGEIGAVKLNLNTSNATGDLGAGLSAGTAKSISWDFSAYQSIAPNFQIMLVADDNQSLDFQALVDEVDSAHLYNYLTEIVGIRHRNTAPGRLGQVQQFLIDEMDTNGLSVEQQTFSFGNYQALNVIGRKVGTEEEDEYLMIDAHYDSVDDSPGADDNASGVAGVLEAMRVLSGYSFEKSIKFVGFDLEETGLVGSNRYVQLRDTAETIGGVFNLEMIGFYSDQPNSQTLPAGFSQLFPAVVSQIAANNYRGDFISVTADLNSTALSAAFANAAQSYVPDLNTIVLDIPVSSSLVQDLRRSDHASFWDVNEEAIMITDGANFRNSNYHTPADQIGTLNFRFMRQVVQATVASVAEIAGIQHATTYWTNTSFPIGLKEGLACDWDVYPNPGSDVIYIRSNECVFEKAEVKVIDLNGKEVFTKEVNISVEPQALNVSHLSAGVYTISVRHKEKKEVRKLVLR